MINTYSHWTVDPKKYRFDRHSLPIRWFSRLSARNPFTFSRWVVCWAVIGIGSGLFAGLYWNVLELLTHFLRSFQGISLLIVMPLSGLSIGLVIQGLGNPGEISLIVDNIHSRGGRIDTHENPSMVLASLVSSSRAMKALYFCWFWRLPRWARSPSPSMANGGADLLFHFFYRGVYW